MCILQEFHTGAYRHASHGRPQWLVSGHTYLYCADTEPVRIVLCAGSCGHHFLHHLIYSSNSPPRLGHSNSGAS